MRKVLIFVCLLALAQHVVAQCGSAQTYTDKLIPECAKEDLKISWPNYENQSTYYSCNGIGKPVLVGCNDEEYFAYVFQKCVTCANYLPPVQCCQLKTQNPPNCVPIKDNTTYPTPNYPDEPTTTTEISTTTEAAEAATTTTTTVATGSEESSEEATEITPPVETKKGSKNSTEVPPAPPPVSKDRDIPMPPTRPSVPATPSSIIKPHTSK